MLAQILREQKDKDRDKDIQDNTQTNVQTTRYNNERKDNRKTNVVCCRYSSKSSEPYDSDHLDHVVEKLGVTKHTIFVLLCEGNDLEDLESMTKQRLGQMMMRHDSMVMECSRRLDSNNLRIRFI